MSHGGKRPGAGRKAGTKGKKTLEIEGKLAALGCDPIALMAQVAMGEPFEDVNGQEIYPTPDQRLTAIKELAQYVAPKRKAVEHSGSIGNHEDSLDELE